MSPAVNPTNLAPSEKPDGAAAMPTRDPSMAAGYPASGDSGRAREERRQVPRRVASTRHGFSMLGSERMGEPATDAAALAAALGRGDRRPLARPITLLASPRRDPRPAPQRL